MQFDWMSLGFGIGFVVAVFLIIGSIIKSKKKKPKYAFVELKNRCIDIHNHLYQADIGIRALRDTFEELENGG